MADVEAQATPSVVAALTGRWRAALIRPAGGGDRRRPADVVRLLTGAIGAGGLYALMIWAPRGDQGSTRSFVDLGLNLPRIGSAAQFLLLGVVPAAVVLMGLGTRSWRLLISVVTAVAMALVVGFVLIPFTEPSVSRQQVLDSLGIPAHFPLLGVAAAIAVLTVARTFLARPARLVLTVLTTVGLVTFVLAENALLLDVAASALVGWAAAGLAGLVFGSPVGDATPEDVARDLVRLGIEVGAVTADGHPAWGTARYRVDVDGGPAAVVDVHGRESEDARALQRAWHAVTEKHGSTRLAVGRRGQAEHEALCLALAERAGVPVPRLVVTGSAGPSGDGYVVVADEGAQPWEHLDPTAVDDELLRAVWTAVAACHQAGFAHNQLDGRAIEVRPDDSVQLTDWFLARSAADQQDQDADVATVLLVTAATSDPGRAVAAAMDVVGAEAVRRSLPLCQLPVLGGRARRDVDKHLAADVRAAASEAVGVSEPDLAELRRISVSDLLMIAGTLLGFWLLYSELASLDDVGPTLASAAWPWVVAVIVFAQVAVICTAVALRGAVVQPIPLGRVIALEYADLFTGLVGGTVAITATNIRFFQRQGLAATTAVTAGVTSSLAGGVFQTLVIVVSLPFVIRSGKLHLGGTAEGAAGGAAHALVVGLLVLALVSGVAFLIPRARSTIVGKVKPKLDNARDQVRDLLRRPRNVVTMIGGQALAQVALALALDASLRSVGGSLPFVDLLLINTFASLIGGLAPVPGGMGAVEAGLIAGFSAFGVDATVAGAATFVYRLFTAYLPPAWGWPILSGMRRRDLL